MNTKRILVTGGPVYAHLDSVKVITNVFKGGRMEALALSIADHEGPRVVYLGAEHLLEKKIKSLAAATGCPPGTVPPLNISDRGVSWQPHTGFESYRQRVLELAPEMDAVVLGAAVANLIPQSPWANKFPSHRYAPGEVVNIPFTVAPRVIDQVRAVMKPHALLIGFKLLDGVSKGELRNTAEGVRRAAHADYVVANDRRTLDRKVIVTPEGGHFELAEKHLGPWIDARVHDRYYTTIMMGGEAYQRLLDLAEPWQRALDLVRGGPGFLRDTPDGPIHGAVAVRGPNGHGMICSARGKRNVEDMAVVFSVDHEDHFVRVRGPGFKASRAAPLFDRLFQNQPEAEAIIHTHDALAFVPHLPVFPYAPPGTVADAQRDNCYSFQIEGHGQFLLLNAAGEIIRWQP